MSHKNQQGFGVIESLLSLIVIILVIGVGYYIYHTNHQTKTTSTTNSSSVYKPATTGPYAGWSQYCSTNEKACFKYPQTWTISKTKTSINDLAIIQSPNGTNTSIYWDSSIVGEGNNQAPDNKHYFIISATPLPHLPKVYLAAIGYGSDTTIAELGLINGTNNGPPTLGDTGEHTYYPTFTSLHQGSTTRMSLDAQGGGTLNPSDIKTTELILESYYYQ